MKISHRKKREGVYCCAYHCYNVPVKKKGGLCHKHYWRLQKEKDPVAVRYNNLKSKAKTRGIRVEITLQEFREFCQRTGYIIVKGRRGKNATIDRRDPTKGYTKENMQLLTHRENSTKGATLDKLMKSAMESNEEVPF